MGDGVFGVLPDGWEETTLGEVCRRGGGKIQTGPFGSQLHASDYVPVGVPTVMPANIGDNRIVENGIARVRETDAQRLTRHRLQLGDIVYSRRGDVERRALVREQEVGWLCGTGSLLVRVGAGFADPVYISLWLGHPQVRAWITQHAVGATMANLNTEILSEVPVVVPPLAEQRAIAGVLGALDDKIESNRRIQALTSDLLHLGFRSICGEAAEECPLTDLAEFTKGVSYRSADLKSSSTAMVTLKSFDRNGGYRPDGLKPYIGPFKPSQVLRQGEIAVAQTDLTQGAEVVGRAIRVPRVSEFDTLVASLDLIVVRPKNGVSADFLYGLLLTPDFREHCRSRTSGTTVLHLGSDALPSFVVALPSLAAQAEFAEFAAPLLANSDRLGAETANLAALRDALLPELLSGRLRVREVEEMVGSV